MLTLAEQQLALRAILRGQAIDTSSDPWLEEIAASKGLSVLHATIAWWQRFQIESQCRYTSRLLKRLHNYAQCVDACFSEMTAAPSIEELGSQFLAWLRQHHDPLVRSLAAFELTCLTAHNQNGPLILEWDRNPAAVLLALDANAEMPIPEPGVRYRMVLDTADPGRLSCVREELAPDAERLSQ